jgi:ADP-ribosylglycohydrolase
MTLFTANGLLVGGTRAKTGGGPGPAASDLWRCYQDWLKTQEMRPPLPEGPDCAWLANVPALFSPRAPGNTCLSALWAGIGGTPEKPVNSSKGCGGVMRVAPVGLYFNDRCRDIREICRLGAEAAALTHGHTLGWLPAAALSQMIHEISQDDAAIPDAALHALNTVEAMWPETEERLYFTCLMEKALDLAAGNMRDLEAIHQLGEGWVGEEALAIAVYCAARYEGDIDRALIAAVNHSGDSDSTGAVTGNILGAALGMKAIPQKLLDRLELKDTILALADDLYFDCRMTELGSYFDQVWYDKYITRQYPGGSGNP